MRATTSSLWTRFHPVTRVVIGVSSVLFLVLFAGVERVGNAVASFSPIAFEARCDALPRSVFTVDVLPSRVIENRSMPLDTLTRMNEQNAARERTIGLTLANFGHRTSFEVHGLEDRHGARACVRPKVAVELYLRPLTVYVAREFDADPCRARVIREHEERHVRVYTTFMDEAAPKLRRTLANAIGTEPYFASDVHQAQRLLDRRIAHTLEGFMREAQQTLAQRQANVDTPEEYARVRSACLASG